MEDGEVLRSGYKVEQKEGEETLVPEGGSILHGISLAIERAERVQKVAPVFRRLKMTGGLYEAPTLPGYRTTNLDTDLSF